MERVKGTYNKCTSQPSHYYTLIPVRRAIRNGFALIIIMRVKRAVECFHFAFGVHLVDVML